MQFRQVAKANSVLTHFDRLKCALREIQTFPLKKERVFHEVGRQEKEGKIISGESYYYLTNPQVSEGEI